MQSIGTVVCSCCCRVAAAAAPHAHRLIDELRNTIRCKAHAKYMDVGLRSPKGFFFWF
jgi:hypothetical protein